MATLSLKHPPYKRTMHAHFRLLGPTRYVGGRAMEKILGGIIFDGLCDTAAANDEAGGSITVSEESEWTVAKPRFFKLTRTGREVAVDDKWAYSKILSDLNRRIETHSAWKEPRDDDDGVLFLSRLEFDEMKKSCIKGESDSTEEEGEAKSFNGQVTRIESRRKQSTRGRTSAYAKESKSDLEVDEDTKSGVEGALAAVDESGAANTEESSHSTMVAGVESSKSNEECVRADDERSKSRKKSEPIADESKPGLERDDSVIGTESKSTVIECIDLAKMPDSKMSSKCPLENVISPAAKSKETSSSSAVDTVDVSKIGPSKVTDRSNTVSLRKEVTFTPSAENGAYKGKNSDTNSKDSPASTEKNSDTSKPLHISKIRPASNGSRTASLKKEVSYTSPQAENSPNLQPCIHDSIMTLKIPRRRSFTSKNEAYPLQAKLAGSSKKINIRINLSKCTESEALNQGSHSKSTHTTSKRHSPKTPNRSQKKFVTPTASALNNSKYIRTTPDPAVGLMVQPCAKGEDFKTDLDKFSEEAAKLGRTKNTTFVEILYALVMNASSNVPSALHWSEDGSSFVVESVDLTEKFILGKYFRSTQFQSFVRQLNLYGWRKLKDDCGSHYYHHFFHRDMNTEESLKHFARKGCEFESQSDVTFTNQSDASFVKRVAFDNARSGIKGAFKVKDVLGGGSESNSEHTEQGETATLVESSKRKRGRPGRPVNSNKKRPGRPRKHAVAAKRKHLAIESNEFDHPAQKRNRYVPEKLRSCSDDLVTPVFSDITASSSKTIDANSSNFVLNNDQKAPTFQVCDRVEARYRGTSSEYFIGVIKAVRSGGMLFDVDYDDGDIDTELAGSAIRSLSADAKNISVSDGKQSACKLNNQVTAVSPSHETILQPLDNIMFGHGLDNIVESNADDWYDALWLSKADEIFSAPSNPNVITVGDIEDVSADTVQFSGPDNSMVADTTPNEATQTTGIATSETPVLNSINTQTPIRAKRLSFMPVENKYPEFYFSPVRPQSFVKPDSKEDSTFEKVNSTLSDFITPSKEQSESSTIEFSWKSSASYSVDPAIANLPSLNLDSFAIHPSEDVGLQ